LDGLDGPEKIDVPIGKKVGFLEPVKRPQATARKRVDPPESRAELPPS